MVPVRKRLSIAVAGTRGVPPRYGGFETFAAELGTRLIARGHRVTVYCRPDGTPAPGEERGRGHPPSTENWRGIDRIVLPAIGHKYLETVSHTFFSAIDALRRDFDVVLLCNAANAFTIPIFRAARMPVAINVDGIERKRRKWNILGQAVYAIGESFSVFFANAVVADAEVIASYYRESYSIEPTVIPYGADFPDENDTEILDRLGLRSRNYVLYVSRFEPENNPLEVVLAYQKLAAVQPLVMVGQGLYAPALVRELHGRASDRVLFPGAVYGTDYRTLQRNALVYVQATEVGGTHPALIEAMASGGLVLAHDTPENREVGGNAIRYFHLRPEETLSDLLREVLHEADDEAWRQCARQCAAERFSWEAVTDAYEALLIDLAAFGARTSALQQSGLWPGCP